MGYIHNIIFFVPYKWAQLVRGLCSGKPLQPSLKFLSEARAYPSKAPFRWPTVR